MRMLGGNICGLQEEGERDAECGRTEGLSAWNGGGTVKLVLIDQGWRRPTETELAALQKEIDPIVRGRATELHRLGIR